jgi:hypothetical protein
MTDQPKAQRTDTLLRTAQLNQLRAETAAHESLVAHHADYRAATHGHAVDEERAYEARCREHATVIRRDALSAAMSWLRDTDRVGFRPGADNPPADIDELLQVAEQFEAWMAGK